MPLERSRGYVGSSQQQTGMGKSGRHNLPSRKFHPSKVVAQVYTSIEDTIPFLVGFDANGEPEFEKKRGTISLRYGCSMLLSNCIALLVAY